MFQQPLLWLALAYLCGSIPFGLLIGWANGTDIRYAGSGNIGATNTARVVGRYWGGLCFLLDTLKGTGPVFTSGWIMGWLEHQTTSETWQWMAIGAAAMIGHIYPVWLKFKGGKGVATGLGVLLGFWPTLTLVGLLGAIVWVTTLALTRYVCLASIAAAVTIPLLLLISTGLDQPRTDQTPFLIATSALAALVIIRHRSNISRLMAGDEPKLGQRNALT